jgi:predicted RNase H-like HicB family nuclease
MQHRRLKRHKFGQENYPMRYTVVLEREEDGGYVASVPALPGCVSQGDTRSEALNNIREAIELYVEDCRDAGDPVPTEAGKEFVEIEAA